ncbi:helix-turn-helix domain-containing protein [Streptomyces sp. NPDC059002]|uniref:helix-turn-helix domain-containing protein n=1 Tax=Streptomyces sp. NPDC059002 TaxID=3346690 RepID=UPI003675E210
MPVERRTLLRTDDVLLADVRCGGAPRGWTPMRQAAVFGLVMVRRGLVRGRVQGVEQLLDPASVYVERLGCEQQFSHPCGDDVYTEIILSEPQVAALLGGDPTVPQGLVFTTPELTLAHRLLLARARTGAQPGGDAFELAERTTAVAARILGQLAPTRVASGHPRSARARRLLVDDARASLGTDVTQGLDSLARAVGCSPHHLSRVFRTETGTTLTRYRNRLRVAHALERLTEGERDLALLANDLGFSDQPHLTHALRLGTGHTPGRLRALLGPVLP